MIRSIRLLAGFALITAAASGTAAFSGEKGARRHLSRVAAGAGYGCTIFDDGSVHCWGYNGFGELGDGTNQRRLTPVAVRGLPGPAVSLALGASHSCAIISNSGSVSCWGANIDGQLGNGSETVSPNPVPGSVRSLIDVVAIAAGISHTCAVRADGSVWCWGGNSQGQLGNGKAPAASFVPVQVPNVNGAVSITAGDEHTCALLATGVVRCWGYGRYGQLGNSGTDDLPVAVSTAPLSTTPGVLPVEISAGGRSTCALLSDGSVSCWGDNSSGQLGTGNLIPSDVPVHILLASPMTGLSVGEDYACAILAGGSVACWGNDTRGAVGDGGSGLRTAPANVPGISRIVEIACGADFSYALLAGGQIASWGINDDGELGIGVTGAPAVAGVVGVAGTFLARGVAAGNQFTCARRGSAFDACWGAGTSGQLGNSASNSSSNPVTSNIGDIFAISAGGAHACSLSFTSGAQCWGDNSRGQLGNLSNPSSNQPVSVSTNGLALVAISAGDGHTCALAAGGTVFCWGAGDLGELGNGGTADQNFPQQVVGIQNAVAVAAGNGFSCALIAGGTVNCWGDNSLKQLGDFGGEPFSALPTTVLLPANTPMTAISAGRSHVCVLSVFGSIWCWGGNSRGQVGNNTTTTTPFPELVKGITNMTSVSAGGFFTCGVRVSGFAYCWGANDHGELSAIDSVDHLLPTPVIKDNTNAALTTVTEIAAGTGSRRIIFGGGGTVTEDHACALLATGVLECWGTNLNGEVGDGTTITRSRPTAVASFVANIDPAAALRNGRVAEVTALIDCESGAEAHVSLTLVQGLSTGHGEADGHCNDGLLPVPVTVAAQGPAGFEPGAATAEVGATVRRNGAIIEDTHWTRQVQVTGQ